MNQNEARKENCKFKTVWVGWLDGKMMSATSNGKVVHLKEGRNRLQMKIVKTVDDIDYRMTLNNFSEPNKDKLRELVRSGGSSNENMEG